MICLLFVLVACILARPTYGNFQRRPPQNYEHLPDGLQRRAPPKAQDSGSARGSASTGSSGSLLSSTTEPSHGFGATKRTAADHGKSGNGPNPSTKAHAIKDPPKPKQPSVAAELYMKGPGKITPTIANGFSLSSKTFNIPKGQQVYAIAKNSRQLDVKMESQAGGEHQVLFSGRAAMLSSSAWPGTGPHDEGIAIAQSYSDSTGFRRAGATTGKSATSYVGSYDPHVKSAVFHKVYGRGKTSGMVDATIYSLRTPAGKPGRKPKESYRQKLAQDPTLAFRIKQPYPEAERRPVPEFPQTEGNSYFYTATMDSGE